MFLLRLSGEFLSRTHFAQSHLLHRVPQYAPHLIILAVVWIVFKLRIKQPVSDVGFRYKPLLKILLVCTLPILLVSQISIYSHFYPNFFISTEYVLSLLVIIPVVEEIVYRGILYSPYRKKYGPIGAILITAVFFAAAHDESCPSNYIAIFLMGSLFAWLYERKQSLIYPIIAHSILLARASLRLLYRAPN